VEFFIFFWCGKGSRDERTRRYSKIEKKSTRKKKERNAFAPAPRTPKKTKPTSQAQKTKKKQKNNRIVPPSETHKLTNKAPRNKRRRDFFKAKEVERTNDENGSNVPDSDSPSAPPPADPLAGAGCGCARGGGGVPYFFWEG
jgi:hypothetical protein